MRPIRLQLSFSYFMIFYFRITRTVVEVGMIFFWIFALKLRCFDFTDFTWTLRHLRLVSFPVPIAAAPCGPCAVALDSSLDSSKQLYGVWTAVTAVTPVSSPFIPECKDCNFSSVTWIFAPPFPVILRAVTVWWVPWCVIIYQIRV